MTSTDEILAERGKRYGVFKDHAMITQMLKCIMTGNFDTVRTILATPEAARLSQALGVKWDDMDSDMTESLEMQAHKIGRILNGDPEWSDSWHDIAGYAKLVADRLDGTAK